MTGEAVLMPDAVAVVTDWLRDKVDADVMSRVPNPRPERLVVVRRVGGVARTRVSDEPMMTVESWAPAEADAMDLAQLARFHIHRMPGRVNDPQVYRVTETAGPAFLPDPLSTDPRATFTVMVHVRGSKPA
jgi:hypothetical protein